MKKRKPIKRLGKVGKRKAEASACAKELYFQRHGNGEMSTCQLCGGPMTKHGCDIHHKHRRWKNMNEPQFLVALHRYCHWWVHLKREREDFLASESCDHVSCADGGVVILTGGLASEWLTDVNRDFV